MIRDMTCEKVQSLLSAYLDSELDYYELRQVELHLADCACCQEECRSLRTTKSLLGMLASPQLPKEFWPELRQQMDTGPTSWYYSRFLAKALVPAAALLVLAILPFAFTMFTGDSNSQIEAQADLIEPYIREYIISELDRPFSDKTSLGFLATAQAVTMYSSDLLESYDPPTSRSREVVPARDQVGRRTQAEAFQRVMFLSPR